VLPALVVQLHQLASGSLLHEGLHLLKALHHTHLSHVLGLLRLERLVLRDETRAQAEVTLDTLLGYLSIGESVDVLLQSKRVPQHHGS